MPPGLHSWSTFPKYRTLSEFCHSKGEDIGLFMKMENLEDASRISFMVDFSKI